MPRRRPSVEGTAEHRARPEEGASVDTVLEFLGVVHPRVAPQLLLTFGVLLVSIGALVIGPLLPLPLYGCWGALRQEDVPRRPTCLGRSLLPGVRVTPSDNEWQCSRGALWWSSVTWQAGLLVSVRLLLTVTAGVAMDVYGRRRVAIVAMGTYFSFALSRSFAPSAEVVVTAVVVEGAAAWAAVVALLLIGLECSTQREAVRSLCLPLVGHSLALVGAALVHATLLEERWRQLAKTLPAMAFVVLVWWLPENPRWLTYRGNWVEARMAFPRTHGAPLDDCTMPKLLTVHRETERSLSSIHCSGSMIRRSVMPVLRCCPLLRVLLLCSACAMPYGLTVGVRLRVEPSPYNSLSDRVLAHGCTELTVLLVLSLLLGRAGAGRLLSGAMLTLGTTAALTTVTWDVGLQSCGVDVMLSLASHGGGRCGARAGGVAALPHALSRGPLRLRVGLGPSGIRFGRDLQQTPGIPDALTRTPVPRLVLGSGVVPAGIAVAVAAASYTVRVAGLFARRATEEVPRVSAYRGRLSRVSLFGVYTTVAAGGVPALAAAAVLGAMVSVGLTEVLPPVTPDDGPATGDT